MHSLPVLPLIIFFDYFKDTAKGTFIKDSCSVSLESYVRYVYYVCGSGTKIK